VHGNNSYNVPQPCLCNNVFKCMFLKCPTDADGEKSFGSASLRVWTTVLLMTTTGAALLENNEASAELTTANGGAFTSSSARLSS